jgi:hypothetical protein
MESDYYTIYDQEDLFGTSTDTPWEDFILTLNASTTLSTPTTAASPSSGGGGNTSEDLCGEGLSSVGDAWGVVHGGLALFVCTLGVIANSLTLVVLTRKGMISPTNRILAGLAFADLLTEIEYMPFALAMKLPATPTSTRKTYAWALFVLAHSNFSQVCKITNERKGI